jgi:hypothetical protein
MKTSKTCTNKYHPNPALNPTGLTAVGLANEMDSPSRLAGH